MLVKSKKIIAFLIFIILVLGNGLIFGADGVVVWDDSEATAATGAANGVEPTGNFLNLESSARDFNRSNDRKSHVRA